MDTNTKKLLDSTGEELSTANLEMVKAFADFRDKYSAAQKRATAAIGKLQTLVAMITPTKRKAWVVTTNASSPGKPNHYLYYDTGQSMFRWTLNIDAALQFSRRADAESVVGDLEDAWSITEHEFAE